MSRVPFMASAVAAHATLSIVGWGVYAADAPPMRKQPEQIHREAIVVDGHNDVTTFILDYGFDLGMDGADPAKRDATLYWVPVLRQLLPHPSGDELLMDTDLHRLRVGGVDAQFFSIFVHPRYLPATARRRALDMIQVVHEQVARHPDQLVLARSVTDVHEAVAQGRIAALMGLEGGHAIEDDLANLREFYELGVRYMTLTWSYTPNWADSSNDEARHGGLTDFGRTVVREMNRLGMIVDISHVSDETFFDTLEVTRAPVMASHSSVRAIADHPRNMSDDMLRALARNGGIVMINFSENFVDPEKAGVWPSVRHWISHLGWTDTPLELLIDHIDHAVRVAGIDHVGLGSDFDGTLFLPEGMKDVSQFPNITVELLRRGYSEEATRQILGENALRVFSQVESAAEPEATAKPGSQP
jgi:membrane dipeptidase